MTDLRDARLQRALQEAPDAQLRPHARTRGRVLEAARQAVAPAPPPAWWKALWSAMGNSRAPWNAAFATVVLATLVTVLWYDREIPGPRSDSPRPEQPAPTAAPAQPAQPAPALAEPAAPAAARAKPQADSQGERQQAQSPAGRRDAAQAKSQPRASDTQLAPPVAEAAREQRNETPAPAAEESRSAEPANAPAEAVRDQDASALAKRRFERADSAPPAGAAAPAPVAPRPQTAPAAPAAAPPAPPAPAAAARVAPPQAGAPLSGLTTQRAAPGLAVDWSGLRISDALGNRVGLSREQAPRLAQLASRVAGETQGREPLTDPVEIRIELHRAGELQAVLELAGAQVRWTDAAGASFTARPPAAQLQALRDEAGRLLRR